MQIKTDWILKNLSISQLDDLSSTFNWFPGDLLECDRDSIEQDGIRLPLLVQSVEDSKFILIDGFKRLSWLKSVQGRSAEEVRCRQQRGAGDGERRPAGLDFPTSAHGSITCPLLLSCNSTWREPGDR